MGIGKRIKEARNALSLTQEELAKKLGITKGAVANYENETSHPKEPIMYKLFEVLNVDANYLFQDVVKIPEKLNDITFSEFDIIKKYRSLDDIGKNHIDEVLKWESDRIKRDSEKDRIILELQKDDTIEANNHIIPYYPYLASAGSGQIIFESSPPSHYIELPDLPKYKNVSYAIGVNGDSMEPKFHFGNILLIESISQISIGEIGIFLVDGETFVKKLGNGELVPLNKKHKAIPLTESSQCLGRVLGILDEDDIVDDEPYIINGVGFAAEKGMGKDNDDQRRLADILSKKLLEKYSTRKDEKPR
ncbi:helix-turn-helix domain-containing protein [Qiania dongpingensis]|uniref:Helix-turn-helix domain-containing protein n=1 Tax=Qiania dongpingensis TaxID=2763669 RepID=A0A7G9G719_9FIRM|nr:helix-turn-helix domain-containing protein [Qiania dongpingensis]QNM06601.1 helix-turn-helix domain-containing protein [Qiania dongpingensis]